MTSRTRRLTAALTGCLLTVLPAASVAPAQATTASSGGLLGPVVSTLVGTVDALTGIVGSIVPTGWLFDDSVTTLAEARTAIGADTLVNRGYDGSGVGVALLDTGVVGVDGLRSGNVVNGPDLSFESQAPGLAHLDTFGHGTHMAGIIAGYDRSTGFRGVAPGARLTSLKLASSDGAVDVSQVIAGLDWVVEHRNDDPRNPIRVINLSYGTDGVQDYQVDPLTHAVENAWRAGIVVVVSGGNEGGALDNPAYDPYVIAVGASDTKGTRLTSDDTVPDFSARGTRTRRVDVTAPGRSIASLRDPGGYLDEAHPQARYQSTLFKGSGTSQAAAVVSGAVALLLDQRPNLTPDQVKALLRSTASPMPLADAAGRGAGEVDVAAAAVAPVPVGATQSWPRSRGTGSLEQARGTSHVADGDTELTGETDVLGSWDAATWAAASSAGNAWVGGRWNGRVWAGSCACDTSWSGATWSVAPWAGRSWAGRSWAGRSWAGRSWAGRSWAGSGWAGRSWAGRSWAGRSWAAAGWPAPTGQPQP
jgi:serine protease AprX